MTPFPSALSSSEEFLDELCEALLHANFALDLTHRSGLADRFRDQGPRLEKVYDELNLILLELSD